MMRQRLTYLVLSQLFANSFQLVRNRTKFPQRIFKVFQNAQFGLHTRVKFLRQNQGILKPTRESKS